MLYGNTRLEAAKLLTGKAPLINIDLNGLSEKQKEKRFSEQWKAAKKSGLKRGVASFGNFNDPKGSDERDGHAVVWLGSSWNGKNGSFGNPWKNTPGTTSVGNGHKRFRARLSRVRGKSFLDPKGADSANDMFILRRVPLKVKQRSILADFRR
jgi:hypothetical protein